MKMHWQTLKSPKFLIGAVILFFVVLWLVNRSGGSSSTTGTMVAAGSDPAALAANTQLQLAGISASIQNTQTAAALQASQDTNATQIALATIQANNDAVNTATSAQIAALGINVQKDISENQNELTFNVTKLAYDNANYSTAVNAALQAHLADNQASAYELSQELAHVTDVRLHGGQRLAVLQNIINTTGNVTGAATSGSSFPIPTLPQTNWTA